MPTTRRSPHLVRRLVASLASDPFEAPSGRDSGTSMRTKASP